MDMVCSIYSEIHLLDNPSLLMVHGYLKIVWVAKRTDSRNAFVFGYAQVSVLCVDPSFMHLITKKRCLMQQMCWTQFAYITNTWSEVWVLKPITLPWFPVEVAIMPWRRKWQFWLAASTIQETITCDSHPLNKPAFCLWFQTWSHLSSISIC